MMKRRLLKIIYFLCYITGITALFFQLNKNKQLIITYHNVIPDHQFDNALHLGVSCCLSAFNSQLEAITQKLKCTTMLGQPSSCVITFDDGYKNNYEFASKVLDEHEIKAYFFVPLNNFKYQTTIWVDKFTMWLSYVPYGKYTLADSEFFILDESQRTQAWSSLWGMILNNKQLIPEIEKEMNYQFAFERLAIASDYKISRFSMMNDSDIQMLKNQGHLIGCHSLNHEILSQKSVEELKNDFLECEKEIGKLYNTRLYSYPFGGRSEVSEKVIERCEESSFTSAVMNCEDGSSEYAISRISLPNISNKFEIYAHLSGLKGFLEGLRPGAQS